MVTGRTFIRRPPGRANICGPDQALSKRTQTRLSVGDPQLDLNTVGPDSSLKRRPQCRSSYGGSIQVFIKVDHGRALETAGLNR